jgi:hypothetical protein
VEEKSLDIAVCSEDQVVASGGEQKNEFGPLALSPTRKNINIPFPPPNPAADDRLTQKTDNGSITDQPSSAFPQPKKEREERRGDSRQMENM